ncbi:MAG TPA: glycosyltransferase family 1 protein [Desulfarculaceae bacterium]|nr:glycosyltransferase family 1 protein [Desulfarculaceae bacterium]
MTVATLAVNARFLTQTVSGTQRFAINISRELKRLRPETIFLSPPEVKNQQIATELEAKVIGTRNYRTYQKLKLPADLLWEQFDLPRYLGRHGYPRLLNLVNLAPYLYTNNIITIHDIVFKLYPQYFSRRFVFLYNTLVPRLARRARHIITVSQHSKLDICNHLLIRPDKVSVVYNAAKLKYSANSQEPPYPWPYILSVGALEPRKNIPRLIAAFQQLADKNLRLIITGEGKSHIFKEISSLKSSHKHQQPESDRIIFTGFLEDQKLTNLYTHAIAFCYPSLYEGFGLPPLEAQTCDCPVLVSHRTSLPEIFGSSALYCDPEDTDDIANKLRTLIGDQKLRAKLKQAGKKNCLRFNWKKSAEKIIECCHRTC